MYIGIDVGGTHTRIVSSPTRYDTTFTNEVTYASPTDYETGFGLITDTVLSFDTAIDAMGIGVPGSVNRDGELDGSTNLPKWVHKPLRQNLSTAFNCPVLLRNDAEIAALGEASFGNIPFENFFYLTWGTGVGCARVHRNDATTTIDRPADRTSIYQLEDKIGGKNITKRFGKLAHQLDDKEWGKVITDLNQALPRLAQEYGFHNFVLGGGITLKQKTRLKKLCTNSSTVEIMLTNLEGKAGLVGALAMLR